jgi:histidyl-tRNA synthetase
VQFHCGGGSFKSRIKKADRSGARLALLIGENERENGQVAIKFLRDDREQRVVEQASLATTLTSLLSE